MIVSRFVEQLNSPDLAARRRAIKGLRRTGGAEAAGALVLVLTDDNPDIRRLAAEALTGFGRTAVKPVLSYLRDWDGSLDPEVIRLVGRLRSRAALDILERRMADRDPEVRTAVAGALGAIGSPDVLDPLLDLLRDLTIRVRLAAADALGSLGADGAVDALLDEMNDEDPAARMAAATALGRIGSHNASEALTRYSGTDPNPEVRRVAESALRQISNQAIGPLIRHLADGEPARRIEAMAALLDQGKTAILPVKDLMRHSDSSVRSAAAEILGVIGDPSAIDALELGVKDDNPQVRITAAGALGRIKDPRSADLLAPLLDHGDPRFAAAAANALEALTDLAIDPVIVQLNSRQEQTRIRAIDVLGRLRHKGVCPRLIAGLTENTPWIRIVSAQALGEIGENQAVPPLIKTLGDHNALVRAMAAEALGKISDYRATMPVLERLKDSSSLVQTNALRALGQIGNPVALPYLAAALDDEEPEIRIAAIEGLVALRATEPLPQLRRMARPWPFGRINGNVRRAARWALDILEAYAFHRAEPEETGNDDTDRQPE